jgi:outer membrane protein assembly factor BamB
MPARDPGLSNFAPDAPGPTEQIAELWTASIGTGLSKPIVHDETLYVGGRDGTVRALDARTGSARWQQSIGSDADTPRVAGDRLVVPTNAAIVALETKDGSEVWRTETQNRADAKGQGDEGRATVLVAPHGVYWIAAGETTAVVGIEPNDGSERWRTEIREPWTPRLFASQESLFVSTGTHSNRPWTIAPDTGAVTGTKPASGYDFPAERFYLDGTVYGVDPFFGVVHGPGWTAGGESFRAGRTYGLSGGASNVYYVPKNDRSDGPGLFALTQQSGKTAWSTDAVGASATRPIVGTETVLVATDETLYCFDPSDGTERWTRPIDDVGREFVVVDDLVYATRDGSVRAFRPA